MGEDLQNILSKTNEYLNVPAVIRFEQPFLDYLADDFNIPGYEVEKHDRILTVRKKGLASDKIITAHIDRHGIVADENGNFEYAAFNAERFYGEQEKHSEKFLTKLGERFIGEPVFAYGIAGNTIAEGKVKGLSIDQVAARLYFEIEGMGKLAPGTPIAYFSQLSQENGRVSSQIDNAISAAVARQLAKDGFDGTFLFATEEEIGRSWKHLVDYLTSQEISSKSLISIDTTPYDDDRAISKGLIVLRNKDQHGVFNPVIVQELKNTCDREGIKYELKDEFIETQNRKLAESGAKPKKLGITELGRIVEETRGALNGATVQVPTTGYHSNHETTSEQALENYYKVLKAISS
ncbi:hypothetical protein JXB28_00210 [Candidatus Woesearchaeota archaeon]|nr:hypothetical protein [Candidatus Woesearchaeota archaeon]